MHQTESALKNHLSLLKDSNGINRVAIYFNLSKLRLQNKNTSHIDIAINVLHDVLKGISHQIYRMHKLDIVVICEDYDMEEVQLAEQHLRHLFSEDPLAYHDGGIPNTDFCQIFNMNLSGTQEFINACNDNILSANRAHIDLSNDNNKKSKVSILEDLKAKIISAISQINISEYINITDVMVNNKKVITDIKFHKDAIISKLKESFDILQNNNMVNLMLEVIDVKLMIKLLKIMKDKEARGYMLRLSLDTLANEEFLIFDNSISKSTKNLIIIGLNIGQVYGDFKGFEKIRDAVKERGYKICISGIEPIIFCNIERGALGVDFLEALYDDKVFKDIRFQSRIKDKLESEGATRVFLSGAAGNKLMPEKLGFKLYID